VWRTFQRHHRMECVSLATIGPSSVSMPHSESIENVIKLFEENLELAALRARQRLEIHRLDRLHRRTSHEPSHSSSQETRSDIDVPEK